MDYKYFQQSIVAIERFNVLNDIVKKLLKIDILKCFGLYPCHCISSDVMKMLNAPFSEMFIPSLLWTSTALILSQLYTRLTDK